MIFYKKETEKNRVGGQTCCLGGVLAAASVDLTLCRSGVFGVPGVESLLATTEIPSRFWSFSGMGLRVAGLEEELPSEADFLTPTTGIGNAFGSADVAGFLGVDLGIAFSGH